FGRNSDTLNKSRDAGIIDEGATELAAAAKRADVLVFCTPVDQIAKQILAAAPHCRPSTLITDTGSTKATIVAAVERGLRQNFQFIGSHPLPGSEKRGPKHARADLFDDRLTLITPTERTSAHVLVRATAFWQALGSRVERISPQLHDEGLALTSHL